MDNIVRFKDLSLRDKQRVYADAYGNPMNIARYMNERNGGLSGGQAGFVSYQDIQEEIKAMPQSEQDSLEDAKKVMIDKKVWDTFEEGNPSFVKNIAEKSHPAFKSQTSSLPLNGVKLTIEHIIKAAELSGDNPKEIVENMKIPTDAEVINE